MIWRIWGEGPPVVLLHGGYGSWSHWIRNIPALARQRMIIAPDLPGFGDSDSPPDPTSPASVAEAVAEGLETVLPGRAAFDLVGFSYGTTVGALAALGFGVRLRAFILIGAGAGGLGLPRPPIEGLRRWEADMSPAEIVAVHRNNLSVLMFADAANIDDLAIHLQTENGSRARVNSRRIRPHGVLGEVLGRIGAPLTALWGERDVFTCSHPEEREAILRRAQADADVRVIEAAGHWAMYEAAGRVNAILLEKLASAGQ